MFNYNSIDKRINTPFLKWEYLISIGLDIKLAEHYHKEKRYKKLRTYFSHKNILCKEDFISFLVSEKNFNKHKAKELSTLAFSDNIDLHELFYKEFTEIISVRNTSLDFYLLRGWSLSNAKIKTKNFFRRGINSIDEKRKNSPFYDEWFRETRKKGGSKSHTIQRHTKQSQFEKELKIILEKHHKCKNFYSPCVHPELNQIYNKRNFIHDFFIDDEFIIEYNGVYWHKDEEFEIKKAFNCIELVKRKRKLSYIIIWENDFDTPLGAYEFIRKCVKDESSSFYSSRTNNIIEYDTYVSNYQKEQKEHKLFKDIVLRFAEESHCLSKKVAALAIRNGRIIATGINGTPEGLTNCDDFFKSYHKAESIKIKFEEWIKTEEWRELHHKWSLDREIHAEQSLICEASKTGINLSNVDIYVSLEPCVNCSKMLASLKPKKIFYVNSYDKSSNKSKKLLNDAGIIIHQI